MTQLTQFQKRLLISLIILLAAIRLISLGMYPLMDSTEARYGEIARKMVELNDWITPWFTYEKPFWGKPPLSFWVTAISFKLFGVNEFAARLPHYLAGISIVWLIYGWMKPISETQSIYIIALLTGALLYCLSSGMVMTDMWMLLGIVMVMRGYYEGMQYPSHRSESVNQYISLPNPAWLIFIGLAIGLLAKGLIALVLCGLPILAWMLMTKNFINTFKTIPILRGLLLTFLIAIPWYVLAEIKTPGFLQYFIIGEHFHRFIDSGWAGDQYGSAHQFLRGSIWLFLLADWLPWTLILPIYFWMTRKKIIPEKPHSLKHQWGIYLWCWALASPLFFTFAGNILWPYVLPAFPAIAILLAQALEKREARSVSKLLSIGLMVSAILLITASMYINIAGITQRRSAKAIIAQYKEHSQTDSNIYFLGKIPYSGEFYTLGKAKSLSKYDLKNLEIGGLFITNNADFMTDKYLLGKFKLITKTNKYRLYKSVL